MIIQVVPNRQRNPRRIADHGRPVNRGGLDNGQLVRRTNTAPQQNLGAAKGASRENNTAGGAGDGHDSLVSACPEGLNLDARDVAAFADDTLDGRVQPEVEVAALLGAGEVRRQGAATLASGVHEGRVGHGAVLQVRGVVCRDPAPASSLQTSG